MEISEIKRRARNREEDYVMPLYLPFLPMLLTIVTVFLAVVSFVLGGILFGSGPALGLGISIAILIIPIAVISAILWIYVLYKWIDRRNNHFKRVELFYEDFIDFLEEKGSEKAAKNARRTLRELKSEMDEKSAILWVILSIIFTPIIFYVYHFLTRDFYKHEQKENFLIEDIEEAVQASGGDFKFEDYDAVEDRNTILYIVLTIITLGIFGLYWIYTITKDPNKHFKQSSLTEKALLDSLETI